MHCLWLQKIVCFKKRVLKMSQRCKNGLWKNVWAMLTERSEATINRTDYEIGIQASSQNVFYWCPWFWGQASFTDVFVYVYIYICMYMRQNSCGFTFSDLQSHSSLPPAWLLEKVASWNSGCFWFCLICESNGQIVCLCYSQPYSLKLYIFLKNSLYCCLGRRGGISPLTACCLWLKHDISGP